MVVIPINHLADALFDMVSTFNKASLGGTIPDSIGGLTYLRGLYVGAPFTFRSRGTRNPIHDLCDERRKSEKKRRRGRVAFTAEK